MTETEDLDFDLSGERFVQAVVLAAGGSVVGRIRLQKVVYLLEQLGLPHCFSYQYHHYGPYSAALNETVEFAKAFNFIDERFENRASDGARYSVFTAKAADNTVLPESLKKDSVTSALQIMNSTSATVLELAATAFWLRHEEKRDDWRDELIRRKGVKTQHGRLDRSLEFLKQIGLGL